MAHQRDMGTEIATVLVEKFCGNNSTYDDAGQVVAYTPARDAKVVYDFLSAIEQEGKIRNLQQYADAASEVDARLELASRERDWKTASALVAAYGMGLGKGPTVGVQALGVRFSAISQRAAHGSINEDVIAEVRKLLEDVSLEIVREVVRERRKAPGRGPDGWRPEVLALAEKTLLETGEVR